MTEDGTSGSNWPGRDERSVVEEMMRDGYSRHWEECRTVVKQLVYVEAKIIPANRHEDIIQEVMLKVYRGLPAFSFCSTLKTWLRTIIKNHIIDKLRRSHNEEQLLVSLDDSSNKNDYEGESYILSKAWSAETTFMLNEERGNAEAALLEYANIHSNSTRNWLIVRMVIFEGHTHIEVAKAAGCSAPVVGYVVREAQKYAREKMGHTL